jgi:hypothetical protein
LATLSGFDRINLYSNNVLYKARERMPAKATKERTVTRTWLYDTEGVSRGQELPDPLQAEEDERVRSVEAAA